MKQETIRELTTQEVEDHISEQAELLSKLKMNHSVTQLENPTQISYARKTIARLKTELKKRDSGAVESTPVEKEKKTPGKSKTEEIEEPKETK